MESQDTTIQTIAEAARKAAERNVYSLSNPYTTIDEKIEIEVWYQLPLDVSGVASFTTGILWAYGSLSWWHAYLISFAVGVITAVVIWFVYIRKLNLVLSKILRFPGPGWLIRIGCAVWLAINGSWLQVAFVIGNWILGDMPVGVGAMITDRILTSRYNMHSKYAFLKHFYGKKYPFE